MKIRVVVRCVHISSTLSFWGLLSRPSRDHHHHHGQDQGQGKLLTGEHRLGSSSLWLTRLPSRHLHQAPPLFLEITWLDWMEDSFHYLDSAPRTQHSSRVKVKKQTAHKAWFILVGGAQQWRCIEIQDKITPVKEQETEQRDPESITVRGRIFWMGAPDLTCADKLLMPGP